MLTAAFDKFYGAVDRIPGKGKRGAVTFALTLGYVAAQVYLGNMDPQTAAPIVGVAMQALWAALHRKSDNAR